MDTREKSKKKFSYRPGSERADSEGINQSQTMVWDENVNEQRQERFEG